MVASEPGGESPETHLRLREERHRREPVSSSEEEEERAPAAEALPGEAAPVPVEQTGPVGEGLPVEEAEEEPTPSIAQEGGEADQTVSGTAQPRTVWRPDVAMDFVTEVTRLGGAGASRAY